MTVGMKSPMTRLASRFSAEHYGFGDVASAVKPDPHFEAPQTPERDDKIEEEAEDVPLLKPVSRESDELDRFFINPLED